MTRKNTIGTCSIPLEKNRIASSVDHHPMTRLVWEQMRLHDFWRSREKIRDRPSSDLTWYKKCSTMKKSCHGLVLSGDRTRVYVKKHAFTHASFKNNDEFIAVFQNVPMRGARGKVGVWRVRNKTSPHDWVNEFYFFSSKKTVSSRSEWYVGTTVPGRGG